jgi:hypothetical protein
MKKKLFKKASINEMKHAATVGGYNHTRYMYVNGYYEAGKELVTIAINESSGTYKKDTLFYPICYNYRHYLELHLKSLIIDTELLYDKMDTLGYLENATLAQKISDDLDNTHNLNSLFELFMERLTLVSNETFPNEIKKYIKQMHDMDTNGQRFRYYTGTDKKLSFQNKEEFDLKNISKIMEEVHDLLWGVDGWLGQYIQMSNDIIHDYEAEMRLEMEQEIRNYYY